MINTPLNLPDDAKYGAKEAAKILGISLSKLYKDQKRGSISGKPRRDNGRLQFTGKEIKRYWKG